MFDLLKLKKLNWLALCLCLALALSVVFAGFVRTAHAAEGGGEPMSETIDLSENSDDTVDPDAPVSNEVQDDDAKAEDGDAYEGDDILTTGAEDGETEESAEDEDAEAAKWERSVKLYTVIAAIAALIIVLVVYFAFVGKGAKRATTRQLVESSIMIAMATVLSLIKIDTPFGGGVTVVSMLPIIIISHRWGWKWGVVTAFVYSVIQLMLGLDNVAYATSVGSAIGIILLDYIVAYSVLGFSGIFGKSFHGVTAGIFVTFTLRFLCHLLAGVIIWGIWMPDEFWGLPMTNPWVYSAMYNGWYMAIELIATELVAMLIYNPLNKFILNGAPEK